MSPMSIEGTVPFFGSTTTSSSNASRTTQLTPGLDVLHFFHNGTPSTSFSPATSSSNPAFHSGLSSNSTINTVPGTRVSTEIPNTDSPRKRKLNPEEMEEVETTKIKTSSIGDPPSLSSSTSSLSSSG